LYEHGTDIVCAFDDVGLVKAGAGTDKERMLLYGWASAPTLDDDGERVLQEGLDVKPLLKKGWVNWNHRQDPDGIIGVPLVAELRDRPGFGKCLYTELELLPSRPMAPSVWKLAKSLEEDKVERTLGLSLEGKVGARSPKGTVKKATVFNIAVTGNPKNDNAPVRALLKGIALDEEVPAEQFNPPPFDGDVMDRLARSLVGAIQKASGTTTVSAGDLIPFNLRDELARNGEQHEAVCRQFGSISQLRGGNLTKAEGALYMHLTTGQPVEACMSIFGL